MTPRQVFGNRGVQRGQGRRIVGYPRYQAELSGTRQVFLDSVALLHTGVRPMAILSSCLPTIMF
jgi:hypothetical protein